MITTIVTIIYRFCENTKNVYIFRSGGNICIKNGNIFRSGGNIWMKKSLSFLKYFYKNTPLSVIKIFLCPELSQNFPERFVFSHIHNLLFFSFKNIFETIGKILQNLRARAKK